MKVRGGAFFGLCSGGTFDKLLLGGMSMKTKTQGEDVWNPWWIRRDDNKGRGKEG